VTGDLHEATIYYTVIGDKLDAEPDHAGVAAALEKAKGRLRTLVGQGTGVRFTPTLAFVADTVPEVARGIDELLAKARAADAEVAARASTAKPAGDADPYKQPRSADDESEDDDDDDDFGDDD
jgi:ribosome-binding factor A